MPLKRILPACALPLVLAFAFWVHSPSLSLGFVSDDFQWWQHSRMALKEPRLLMAAHGGYRPANTWTLSIDHLIFGTDPFGYHLTNIILHLVTGLVLWTLLGRFGIPWPTRATCVLLWLCSPYSLEPAQFVANRFDLILLCCWMGLAILWPEPGQRWTRRRAGGALLLALLSLFCKESWIVLPGFVFVFELVISGRSLWKSSVHAALISVAIPIYLALYFRNPTIDAQSYYDGGIAAAAKIPHAWAAFLSLTPLIPANFPVRAPEIIGLAVMSLFALAAWRWRTTLAGIGAAIFVLPFIPVLPVNFMPTRYTALALAGFLTMIAALLHGAPDESRRIWKRAAAVGFYAFAIFTLITNLIWLRGDFMDARRLSEMTGGLIGEFRAFAPSMPRNSTLIAVRLERRNPLELLAADTQGVDKVFFVRAKDPYGLADWPALISYCLDPTGGPIFVHASDRGAGETNYAVIGHDEGGFRLLPAGQRTATEAASAWERMGYPASVIERWQGDPRSRTSIEADQVR